MSELERLILLGPRVPRELLRRYRMRYLAPTLLLGLAALLLFVSVFLPYWDLTLRAPQYPKGLKAQIYINRVVGDVDEIDILNHYIGMRSLKAAALLERSLSVLLIVGVALLVFAATVVHNPWAALLALPALVYPLLFLGDLYFWLRNYGMNLDPKAPLSGAIKPFIPPLFGEGKIGQFSTTAALDTGFYLAVAASVLILVGLYFHRRAYKPLLEEWEHLLREHLLRMEEGPTWAVEEETLCEEQPGR